ncbi:MAG: polysaccharide deacetylase family protein [Clostridia bacterium]|jgi:peptidoglycan/xylan/chitin deacetylase (PgdA/CDA1 family)
MASDRHGIFRTKKPGRGSRFLLALILLMLTGAGAYGWIRGFLPLSWIPEEADPEAAGTPMSPAAADTAGPPRAPEENRPFVAKPPLPLDAQTEQHLASFRKEAQKLAEAFPQGFILKGSGNKKRAALSFDDGPDAVYTPRILSLLQQYGVKATFFLKGERVQEHPEITKKILSQGHEIGNHAWSHPRFQELSLAEAEAEIRRTEDIIQGVTGIRPRLIRPPYGIMTGKQIACFMEKGYRIIDWSIDSMDWYSQDEELIFTAVTEVLHNDAIILMHAAEGKEGREGTIQALERLLLHFQEKGIEPVTVSQLLEDEKMD